eukprot:9084453-Karenia_brevis.AAC.1
MAASLTYPPVFSDDFLEKTAGLSQRASELVYHIHQTLGPASQQEGLTLRDLDMSCYYGKEKKEEMPCI